MAEKDLAFAAEVDEIVRNTTTQEKEQCCRGFIAFFEQLKDIRRYFIASAVVTSTSIILYAVMTLDSLTQPVQTYNFFAFMLVLNSLCACYFAITAVFQENGFQILAFCITQVSLLIRLILTLTNAPRRNSVASRIPQVIVAVIGFAALLIAVVLAYPVYTNFGWKMFRQFGAKRHLQVIFRDYQRFTTCLQLDVQFLTMVFFLFSLFLYVEYAALLLGIVVISYSTDYVIKPIIEKEHKLATIAWIVFKSCMPGYWIYRLVLFQQCWPDTTDQTCLGPKITREPYVADVMWFYIVEALICRFFLIVFTITVYRNYGKGLHEVISNKEPPGSQRDSGDLDAVLLVDRPNTDAA